MPSALAQHDEWIEASGHRLEVRTLGQLRPDQPTLVFLHEGLGCIALWRQFPADLCAALGLPGVVYSRAGYGGSQAIALPRPVRFMHTEALTLGAVLAQQGVTRAILVGHSDGGSIALLHAASGASAVVASIVMAPHLFVEPMTVAAIRAIHARFDAELKPRLARYHRDPQATFMGWADIWLDPAFAHWTIEDAVARITTPVLALQGWQDEYGSMAQVQRLASLAPRARWEGIDDCRHSPFIDQPARVIASCQAFLGTLGVISAAQTPAWIPGYRAPDRVPRP